MSIIAIAYLFNDAFQRLHKKKSVEPLAYRVMWTFLVGETIGIVLI